MTNLFKIEFGKLSQFLGELAKAGLTAEMVEEARKQPILVRRMVETLLTLEINHFKLSVNDQLTRFTEVRDALGWCISDDVIKRLRGTAPEWPEGRLAVRSLRIRFGNGREGVVRTFEEHIRAIKYIFGDRHTVRTHILRSGFHSYKSEDVDCLRLLAGNETHKPCVDWVVADLAAHWERVSIKAVRSDLSLADELYVVTWLFPEIMQAIDYREFPGYMAAGYELNVPEDRGELWRRVPCIFWDENSSEIHLHAYGSHDKNKESSVPELKK